jgi:hypothetical protein
MSNVLQSLFGGSSSKQSSTPVDTTPPELAALRAPFASSLTSLFQQGGRPAYPGPFVAPITGAEETALGATAGAAYDPNRANLLAQTLSGNFLPGQPGANPFLDAAIRAAQAPTRQALNDTLARTLPGTFTAAGQQIGGGLRSPNPRQTPGSTAFDLAAARAFEGGAGALSNIATNMAFQGYESERGRQQQAIPLSQQEVQTMTQNLQAQALPRLIQDLGIERGLAEFQSRMNSLLQALGIAAGAPIATQGNQQTATSEAQKGIIPGLLPKGLQGG